MSSIQSQSSVSIDAIQKSMDQMVKWQEENNFKIAAIGSMLEMVIGEKTGGFFPGDTTPLSPLDLSQHSTDLEPGASRDTQDVKPGEPSETQDVEPGVPSETQDVDQGEPVRESQDQKEEQSAPHQKARKKKKK